MKTGAFSREAADIARRVRGRMSHPARQTSGRHSAAILRMMGFEDTIATTADDYVAIATRLGKGAPVAALEDFLEKAVRS